MMPLGLYTVDRVGPPRYNHRMKKLPRLRAEKRRLLRVRDAALSPRRRLEVGAAQSTAARTLFMAGMAARGFSRSEALRAWRDAPIRRA